MRKPTFCISDNKDADQLRGNRKADQRLCFRYIDSAIPLLSKSEISSLYPSSVAAQSGLCQTRSETRTLIFSNFHFTIVTVGFHYMNMYSKSFYKSLYLISYSLYIGNGSRTQVMGVPHNNEPCHEKTNILVSDLVLHKPGCTVTEDC